jgi:hypothetical protein
MKLLHRGMTLELEDQDPRVAVIEALLFGQSLPPPFPLPPDLVATHAAPLAEPPVAVPDAMRRFWEALKPSERKELVLLSGRPYRAADLEEALGAGQRVLMGRHSRMAKLAKRLRLGQAVRARGRTRKGRSYCVSPEMAAWLGALAAEPPPSPPPLF